MRCALIRLGAYRIIWHVRGMYVLLCLVRYLHLGLLKALWQNEAHDSLFKFRRSANAMALTDLRPWHRLTVSHVVAGCFWYAAYRGAPFTHKLSGHQSSTMQRC